MTKSNTDKILTNIAVVQNDIAYIKDRLNKINGNLEDYPVYKERVNNLEESIDKITNCIGDIKKLLNGIKIKVWGMSAAIGVIMGFIGIIIGRFLGWEKLY